MTSFYLSYGWFPGHYINCLLEPTSVWHTVFLTWWWGTKKKFTGSCLKHTGKHLGLLGTTVSVATGYYTPFSRRYRFFWAYLFTTDTNYSAQCGQFSASPLGPLHKYVPVHEVWVYVTICKSSVYAQLMDDSLVLWNCILMSSSLCLATAFYCISLHAPQGKLLTPLPMNPSTGEWAKSKMSAR